MAMSGSKAAALSTPHPAMPRQVHADIPVVDHSASRRTLLGKVTGRQRSPALIRRVPKLRKGLARSVLVTTVDDPSAPG